MLECAASLRTPLSQDFAATEAAGAVHNETNETMPLPVPKDVTFDQINQILAVTDALDLDREWIEIPLSAASPGKIHKLPNGKIEIVVDAEMPFDAWLAAASQQLRQVAGC